MKILSLSPPSFTFSPSFSLSPLSLFHPLSLTPLYLSFHYHFSFFYFSFHIIVLPTPYLSSPHPATFPCPPPLSLSPTLPHNLILSFFSHSHFHPHLPQFSPTFPLNLFQPHFSSPPHFVFSNFFSISIFFSFHFLLGFLSPPIPLLTPLSQIFLGIPFTNIPFPIQTCRWVHQGSVLLSILFLFYIIIIFLSFSFYPFLPYPPSSLLLSLHPKPIPNGRSFSKRRIFLSCFFF